MHQIYIIHNIIYNKIYVGKSANPIKRWIKHKNIAQSKRKREKFYLHRGRKLSEERCAARKGKFIGEKNPLVKISEDVVISIRNKYKNGFTKTQLAREYKVGRTQVRRIINKESWKHI